MEAQGQFLEKVRQRVDLPRPFAEIDPATFFIFLFVRVSYDDELSIHRILRPNHFKRKDNNVSRG